MMRRRIGGLRSMHNHLIDKQGENVLRGYLSGGEGKPEIARKTQLAMLALTTILSVSAPADAASPAAKVAAQRLAKANLVDRPRPRIIVTSDVEIDDVASWHRFWLYANEFDIEGIIYSSSRFHWAGDPETGVAVHDWAGNDVIEQMIKGFGKFGSGGGYSAVYPTLLKHDPRYPSPDELLSKVRLGNIGNLSEMAKNTPGSELIKEALLSDRPGPLYLQAWGGTNTIASALRSIEDQYSGGPDWDKIYSKVVRTARVYIILDQDATYKDYIAKKWPDLYTIYNRDMFWSVAYPQFRNTRTPPLIDSAYFGRAFMGKIAQGPMLQTYPLFNPDERNARAANPARIAGFTSEGDSPAYWYVLPTGLRSDENPSFGGWGGRFTQVGKTLWTDRPDALGLSGNRVRDEVPGADTDARAEAAPLTRWIPALQNDFLARSRWTQVEPKDANHEPVVRVTRSDANLSVKTGKKVTLSGQAADPDGDHLNIRWWQYREAGTYAGEVAVKPDMGKISNEVTNFSANLSIPTDAKPGDTIHIIAEVTDSGSPPVTRYGRFVLTVQ